MCSLNIRIIISRLSIPRLLVILFFAVFMSETIAAEGVNFTNRSTGHTPQEIKDLATLVKFARQDNGVPVWLNLGVNFYADANENQARETMTQIKHWKRENLTTLILQGHAEVLPTPLRLSNAPGIYLLLSAEGVMQMSKLNSVRNIIYFPNVR